jgi:hypothetical protein
LSINAGGTSGTGTGGTGAIIDDEEGMILFQSFGFA